MPLGRSSARSASTKSWRSGGPRLQRSDHLDSVLPIAGHNTKTDRGGNIALRASIVTRHVHTHRDWQRSWHSSANRLELSSAPKAYGCLRHCKASFKRKFETTNTFQLCF